MLSLTLLAALSALSTITALPQPQAASSPARPIVKGKTFDRIVSIWLENTDYAAAVVDPNLSVLASQGITLTNYNAITHPSQPNYIGFVGGSTNWVIDDLVHNIAASAKTVVDLLEPAGISWGEYQEDMPSTGYTGETGSGGLYVRKHNPLMSYNSINQNPARLANIKNFTLFYDDLANDRLPQWIFITPNMNHDGHDTSITTSGAWTRNFLTPLLSNPAFTKNTLILLTFDEAGNWFARNRVWACLLGDVIPVAKRGTSDAGAYTHYSHLKTVETNWGLGNLGGGDKGAAAFF